MRVHAHCDMAPISTAAVVQLCGTENDDDDDNNKENENNGDKCIVVPACLILCWLSGGTCVDG